MCGITGFLSPAATLSTPELEATVRRMAESISYRGPDDSAEWADEACGIALGFRRLAILDLSPTGRQPMTSASGRYVIVFNGEVYNHPDLRSELESRHHGIRFRGGSDTEVILAAIEAFGIKAAVQKFVGMFAIALWDRAERRLTLVRDRLGVKPLYYGLVGKSFVFGSELKAIRQFPGFSAGIDRSSLAQMVRYGYVPSPASIFEGISKLAPGSMLSVSPDDLYDEYQPQQYWSMEGCIRSAALRPYKGGNNDAIESLDTLLRDATAIRMAADVPLGVFLSGGIDSSLITALMQVQSGTPVKTFTIGFEESGFDEAVYARAVAAHLGTNHTEFTLSSASALAAVPEIASVYDEPFADASQIPTLLVARMARRDVTVTLSGDGGDELFGGYVRHFGGRRLWKTMQKIPRGARIAASKTIGAVRPDAWRTIFQGSVGMLPSAIKQRNPVEKLSKLAGTLGATTPEEMYALLVSKWRRPSLIVNGASDDPYRHDIPDGLLDDITLRMMYMDTTTYLPDDILVKVDRATMAVSLEARSPFLDHRVLEFAWQLPLSLKLRNGEGKWIVKQVLNRYVPANLYERPKAGFSVPLDEWLRGPLRPWAEDLLSEAKLTRNGFFKPEPIRRMWNLHLERRHNEHSRLWPILMFQAWIDNP